MSRSIDERIVDMQFNNRQFESGVKTTMGSIEKLKKSLNFEKATEGFSKIENASNRVNFSNMSAGIDALTSKFSALGVMGFTVLQRLTNAVIDFSKKINQIFAIGPVSDGYNDYIRKINSVQTIMNATGRTIEDVSKFFSELDIYADKTIYDLADMTSAMAKFTNAGVDLETAVPAIKGIANSVALAGQGSREASIAFYNLAQSIDRGYLDTLDFKSLQLQHIATKQWKQEIVDTAVALGTLKQNSKGLYDIKGAGKAVSLSKLFTESLSEQWATTEVLLKVYGKYGDETTALGKKAQAAAQEIRDFGMMMTTLKAQVGTGWTDTFEILIGDLHEAKELWTGITNAIGAFLDGISDARNGLLGFWKAQGGRADIFEGIANILFFISDIIKPIEKAFRSIFEPLTGEKLVAFSKAFKDLTATFKIGEEQADLIRRTFSGVFAVVDILRMGILGLLRAIGFLNTETLPLRDALLGIAANIGDMLVNFRNLIKYTDGLTIVFTTLKGLITPLINGITTLLSVIANGFQMIESSGTGSLETFRNKMKQIFAPLIALGEILLGAFQRVFPILSNIFKGAANAVEVFLKQIGTELESLNFETLVKIINGVFLTSMLSTIDKFVKSLTSITEGVSSQFKGIGDILEGVGSALKAYQQNLNAKTLLTIASAIAVLAAALVGLSMVKADRLEASLQAVSVLFAQMFVASGLVGRALSGAKFLSSMQLVLTFGGLAASILLLSFAMHKLATVDWDGLARGSLAIGALVAAVIIATKFIGTGRGLIRTSIALIGLGVSMNVFATAMQKLGSIKIEEMKQALIGLAGVMTILIGTSKLLGKSKSFILTAISLNILSIALITLSVALRSMSLMTWDEIGRGLTVLAGAMLILVASMKMMSSVIAGAVSFSIISAALLLLVPTLKMLGKMDWGEIARSLSVLAGALLIIAGAMAIMPAAIPGALALGIVAGSLLLLAPALKLMSGFEWDGIARGLSLLAGSLAIIAGGMYLMAGGIPGAIAMTIMAGALMLFVPALALLSSIPILGIVTGLAALAGIFAVIGAAGYFLAPVVPAILALGASILMLGAGFAAIGGGMLLFGTGLGILVTNIVLLGESIGTAINALIKVMPAIGTLLTAFIEGLINAMIKTVPKLLEGFTVLLDSILKALGDGIPKIVEFVLTLLTTLIGQIDAILPELIEIGINIIVNLLKGLSDAIGDIVDVGVEIIVNFIKGIGSTIDDIIQAGIDLYVAFVQGIADAIRENDEVVINATLDVVAAMLEAAVSALEIGITKFGELGLDMIEGLIGGLEDGRKWVVKKMEDVSNDVVNVLRDVFDWHSPPGLIVGFGGDLMEAWGMGISANSDIPLKAFKQVSTKMVKETEDTTTGLFETLGNVFKNLGVKKDVEKSLDDVEKSTKKSTDKITESTESSASKAEKARKKKFDKEKEMIEEKKYYNLLSLKEEYEEWKELQGKYAKDSEERKEIDREVYRLKNELGSDAFQHSLDWIDEKRYYEELALTEELAAWKRVQARYLDGTQEHVKAKEELKQVNKEIFKIEKQIASVNKQYQEKIVDAQEKASEARLKLEDEYYKKSKEINDKLKDDLNELTDEYKSAVDDRAETLYSAYSLFEKVELKDAVKGTDLIENLESQVEAMQLWRDQINLLKSRGVNVDLVEELQSFGPDAVQEIRALNKLSEAELDKYVSLWAEKHKTANDRASYELTDFRNETLSEIDILTIDAKKGLEEYRKVWVGQFLQLAKDSKKSLVTIRDEWLENVGDMRTATDEELLSMMNSAISVFEEGGDWDTVGEKLIEEIVHGAASSESKLLTQLAKTAKSSIVGVENSLGIRGPSKIFAKIGEFTMLGWVEGIQKYSNKVTDETSKVAERTKEALTKAFTNMSELLSSTLEYSPTITPVIDMSNVEAGLNATFGQNRSINVDATTDRVASTNTLSRDTKVLRDAAATASTAITNDIVINNMYTVRDDSDIRRISVDLKNTLDRYNYAKGVVVTQ